MSCISHNIIIIAGDGAGTENSIAKWKTVSELIGSNVFIDNNDQVGIGSSPSSNTMLDVNCSSADKIGLKIKAHENQTEDLLKVVSNDESCLFVINYQGDQGITVCSPNEPLHVQSDYDGNRAIRIGNESEGTAAVARLIVDVYGGSAFLAAYGSNFTTEGSKRANSGSLITNANLSGGLSLVARHATTGDIRFYTGGNLDSNERGIILANGNWGINEASPETLLEMTNPSPFITLHCNTNSDVQDSGKCELIFKRQRSGTEESTHAKIVAAHNGIFDDEIGYIGFNVNSGLEGNSPTERMKITSDILESKTDMIFSGSGTGFPYGCIAGDNETITCTLQDTYYQVTFDTIGCENLTTGSIDNNDIIIQKTGIYRMTANISFHSTVAHDFEFQIKKNDGATDIPHAHSYQTTMVANQIEHTSIGPIPCSLTIDDTLELWVKCTDAAGINCIIDHVNLCTDMVGG